MAVVFLSAKCKQKSLIRRHTLVVRNLVTRLVDARKAEVAVLAYLAILGAVYDHGCVSCVAEFLLVSIVDCKTDGFATEPVT
jgi:hypothetical protein